MMRQAVHRHRAGAERSGCRLEPSIEGEVSGLLDQLAVEQIADNLLSNAVKYGAGDSLLRLGAVTNQRDLALASGCPPACRCHAWRDPRIQVAPPNDRLPLSPLRFRQRQLPYDYQSNRCRRVDAF